MGEIRCKDLLKGELEIGAEATTTGHVIAEPFVRKYIVTVEVIDVAVALVPKSGVPSRVIEA